MADEKELVKVAEALFDSALENNKIDSYYHQMKFLSWLFDQNPDYFKFVNSTSVDKKNIVSFIDKTVGDAFDASFVSFIIMLVTKGYMKYFYEIQEYFRDLVNNRKNIVEGVCYSPFTLSDNDIKRMEKIFSKKMDKTVRLKQIIDKDLVLGVKIVIGNLIYELSAESQLEHIKARALAKANENLEVGENE